MIIVPKSWAMRALAEQLADGDLADAEIHLLAADLELTPDITLAELQAAEAVDDEFTAGPAVTWLAPYYNELGQAQVDGQLAQFVAGADPTLQTIYAYWLQTATDLICVEKFVDDNGDPRPVTINAEGDVVEVAPQFASAGMAV